MASSNYFILEFTREKNAGSPHTFDFEPQTYSFHLPEGGIKTFRVEWSTQLLGELAELGHSGCDPDTAQRVGNSLARTLGPIGWLELGAKIRNASLAGHPVVVAFRFNAAELYALPWELLVVGESGQHLGELDRVAVRYEWPQTDTTVENPSFRGDGRILFAWSAAGGPVPYMEHQSLLTKTWAHMRSEPVTLANASAAGISDALAKAKENENPFEYLHLLAHGDRVGSSFGLLLESDSGAECIDPGRLRRLLAPYAPTLRVVVVAACDGGNVGDFGNQVGSVAQALHRAGFRAVLASRSLLSVQAANLLTEAFYNARIVDKQSIEDAVVTARRRLISEVATLDWASLQLYARGDTAIQIERPSGVGCNEIAGELHARRERRAEETPLVQARTQMARRPHPDYIPQLSRQREAIAHLVHDDCVCVGIVGFGGYGKTELARAIAYDSAIRERFPDGVLWLQLSAQPKLLGAIRSILRTLTGRQFHFDDIAEAFQALGDLLAQKRYLLIIDDAWDLETLLHEMSFFPQCGYLFTTRNRALLPGFCHVIDLDKLSEEDSCKLLCPSSTPLTSGAPTKLRALAAKVRGWPVLIMLIRAHLRYLTELGESLDNAARYVCEKLDEAGPDSFSEPGRSRSIAQIIDMSLNALNPEDRERLLDLAIFPEDLDIPNSTVAKLWNLPRLQVVDVCLRLRNHHLVEIPSQPLANNSAIRLHDVVRTDLRTRFRERIPFGTRKLLEGHGLSLTKFAENLPRQADELGDYITKYLPTHLIEIEEWDALNQTLCDFGYLRKRSLLGEVYELEQEIEHALEVVPRANASALKALLKIFRDCSHILVEHCGELPDILYNRMIARGVSQADILHDYRLPAGLPDLRLHAPLNELYSADRVYSGHCHCTNECVLVQEDTRLISASCDGTLRMWDVASGRCLRILTGHKDIIDCCASTPDGTRIVSGSRDGCVVVWNGETGEPARMFREHRSAVKTCSISADGRIIATTSNDGTIRFHNFDTLSDGVISLQHEDGFGYPTPQRSALSEDGELFILVTTRKLYGYSVSRRELLFCIDCKIGFISDCRLNSRKQRVFVAGPNGAAYYDIGTEILTNMLTIGEQYYHAGYLGHDNAGPCFFLAHSRRIDVFRPHRSRPVRSLRGHSSLIKHCTVARDTKFIVTCSRDRTLRRIPLSQADERYQGASNPPILFVAATSDQEFVALTTDGHLKVFDPQKKGQLSRTVDLGTQRLERRGITVFGTTLLALDSSPRSSERSELIVVDLTSLDVKRYSTFAKRLKVSALLPSRSGCIGALNNQLAWIEFGQRPRQLGSNLRWPVENLVISHDSGLLVTTHKREIIRVADAMTGQEIRFFSSSGINIEQCIAIDESSSFLATGGKNGQLAVWNLTQGELVRVNSEHNDRVNCIAIDRERRRLVSASDDQTIRIWEFGTGHLLACYRAEFWFETVAILDDFILAGDSEGNTHLLKYTPVKG